MSYQEPLEELREYLSDLRDDLHKHTEHDPKLFSYVETIIDSLSHSILQIDNQIIYARRIYSNYDWEDEDEEEDNYDY
jgi:CHASE3 domain sensor protein